MFNSTMLVNDVTALGSGFGQLYIATDGGGITTLENGNWVNLDTSLVDDYCAVTDIAFAAANDVWVVTENNCGMKHIIDDQLVLDTFVFNLSLSTVEIDGEGTAWVGNYGNGGLYEYIGNNFTSHNEVNSDNPNDYVWGISIVNDSTRWVVGTHEVGLMADSGWTIFPNTFNPYPLWWDVAAEGNESAWFATTRGLVNYDGSGWTIYDETNSGMLASQELDDFPDLVIDQDGTKWLASFSGLIKFDNTNWTVYNTSNSDLPSNTVNVVEVDSINNIWVGTDNGLVKIAPPDPNGIDNVKQPRFSISPNPVNDVLRITGIDGFPAAIISIFDLTGKKILQAFNTNEVTLGKLDAGFYSLIIESEYGIQTFPIVKQ
jgi:hypothetical protein